MKYQGENENRKNTFDSHEFIQFTADLIGPLYIFRILLSSIYINIYICIYIYIYTYIYIYKTSL